MQTAYQFSNAQGIFKAVVKVFPSSTPVYGAAEIRDVCECHLEIWQLPVGFGKQELRHACMALWSNDGTHVAKLMADAKAWGWIFDLKSGFDLPQKRNQDQYQEDAINARAKGFFNRVVEGNSKVSDVHFRAASNFAWCALASNAAFDCRYASRNLQIKYNQ